MRRLFIMRKDLNMSHGKLGAQIGHCAEAYWTKLLKDNFTGESRKIYGDSTSEITGYYFDLWIPSEIVDDYVFGSFVKTVCAAKNKNHLLKAKIKAEELGLVEGKDFGLIYDNCLTELIPEEENGTTLTGIWFKPLPDDISHQISKKYQLYK